MELNCDQVGNSRCVSSIDKETENRHYERMEKTEFEFEGCGKVSADNVIDELPADPFDMEIKSTFTAITGWFQDSEEDFDDLCLFERGSFQDSEEDFDDLSLFERGSFQDSEEDFDELSLFEMDESDKDISDHKHFSGFNFVWNSTVRVQQQNSNLKIDEISIPYGSFSRYGIDNGDYDNCLAPTRNVNKGVVCNEDKEDDSNCGEGGTPHDALFFAFRYLGVKDLLVVERVCRSFRNSVRSDPILWRSIHIDQPLSEKITDDILVNLTSRAQGILQCMSLMGCSRITDSGLRRVLESNPMLSKLSVPGCLKLTIEGILLNLRAFNSDGSPGIKHLRVGSFFNITDKQFEELKSLLGADDSVQQRTRRPQFYRWGQFYLSCDDDRAIDIESCPKCQNLGLVYDCPAESCQAKPDAAQLCRACRLCISRCFCCGRCFEDCDYEETFSLDLFCLDCLKELLICEEKLELKGSSSSKRTIFVERQDMSFIFMASREDT